MKEAMYWLGAWVIFFLGVYVSCKVADIDPVSEVVCRMQHELHGITELDIDHGK